MHKLNIFCTDKPKAELLLQNNTTNDFAPFFSFYKSFDKSEKKGD